MQSLCNQSVTRKMSWLVGRVTGVMINAALSEGVALGRPADGFDADRLPSPRRRRAPAQPRRRWLDQVNGTMIEPRSISRSTMRCASDGKQCPSSSARSARAMITSFCTGVTDSAQTQSRAARLISDRAREDAAQQRQDRPRA
jgi:hypothetical protein